MGGGVFFWGGGDFWRQGFFGGGGFFGGPGDFFSGGEILLRAGDFFLGGGSLTPFCFGRGYCPEGNWTITPYCPEGFRTLTSYCPEPLSNVRRCWLVMPLGAGFLRWVLACRTIEKKTKVKFIYF